MNLSKMPSCWKALLEEEFKKDYFIHLSEFLKRERSKEIVFPEKENVFSALELCKVDNLKVVIIGQDPYHGQNQANGLAFSVSDEVRIPPSLRNIFKELKSDIGTINLQNGNLEPWARQGVLLLNSVLSVKKSTPNSHKNKGWEIFTDKIIEVISKHKSNIVFVLWGNYAIKKGDIIDCDKHLILTSAHPSPFSAHRGFIGNKHFSKINNYLKDKGLDAITW